MKQATLLAILILLAQNVLAGPEEQRRELEKTFSEYAEIMDRKFQQRLDQLIRPAPLKPQLEARAPLGREETPDAAHGDPVQMAGIVR